MGRTHCANARKSAMQENHPGYAGRQKEGWKAKPWIDGVNRDAERLGIRNWRTKAMDRAGWRLVIESVKTLHGL